VLVEGVAISKLAPPHHRAARCDRHRRRRHSIPSRCIFLYSHR
jgi:hypothetical protein